MKCLLAAIVCLIPSPLFAQRDAKVPDSDPEIERQSFIVAPGFEVMLFAADPILAKPIQMNFDPQGRLWVATSEVYPQIRPGQVANDKILILEDTKGTGKADKVTVFADGLLIPTGVLPGDGGAYVANSTEILHLSASKPGGKADKRRVVLSGFGTEDTHHIIHTFRWGPDGAMYFNQSVYIHSHVETPHGTKRLNGGGIWRYEPKSQKLDVFVRGFWNPWGHQFDKYGNSFITDGAYGEGIVHGIPGASYPTGGNQAPRVLHGMNPGSPKFCGLEIISGRHFPDDWQGDCITNDFRGHRVCRFKLRDAGSTFESREMTEVIKSNHPAFRPIDCLMGPDGALYIADWYNPIIQHGEVDFRDERRDHTHGRIWRVTAKGRPLVERPNLVGATVPELLEQLKSPEDWTRRMAKRLLAEHSKLEEKQGPGIVLIGINQIREAADTLLEKQTKPNEDLLLELFWVHQAMASVNEFLITRMMAASNPAIRAVLARFLGSYGDHLGHLDRKNGNSTLYQNALLDESPRVRLEAIRSLAQFKDNYFANGFHFRHALMIFDKPMDGTLEYAVRLSLRELAPEWMPEFVKGKLNYGNDMKKLAFALEAVQSPEVVPGLVKILRDDKTPQDRKRDIYRLLARIGGPEEMSLVFHEGYASEPAEYWPAVLVELEKSIRTRKVVPKSTEKWSALSDHCSSKNLRAAERRAALRLAGLIHFEEFRSILEKHVLEDADREDRRAAFDGLVSLGGAKTRSFIQSLMVPTVEPDTRCLAIAAFISIDVAAAAKEAATFFTTANPGGELEIVFSAFLHQKNGAAVLAKALDGVKLPVDVAKIGLKAVRSDGNPSPALTAALTKAGNLTAKKEPTAEDIKSLTADVFTLGDAARGEAVFRRKEFQCFACHAIGGAGGKVGPDLTSIGASAQTDYLVESLLLPNKAIKEGYHTINITLHSGKLASGIKVREADGELVLRDKDDKEISLRVDEIESRRNGRSLMPDGLTDPLTRAELLDLVRFLGELGKIGPYEPTKARVVRTWEVVDASPENLKRFQSERAAVAAEKPESIAWTSAYSCVSGDLPLVEVPSHEPKQAAAPTSILRFRLKVTTAGEIKLNVNKLDGLEFFHGATPLDAAKPFRVEIGEPIITVLVNRSQRNDHLRITLDDVPKSTARAAVVVGK